jgi:hypothetical protein
LQYVEKYTYLKEKAGIGGGNAMGGGEPTTRGCGPIKRIADGGIKRVDVELLHNRRLNGPKIRTNRSSREG